MGPVRQAMSDSGLTMNDIDKILLFLCSDDSAPLNGQALVADYGANL